MSDREADIKADMEHNVTELQKETEVSWLINGLHVKWYPQAEVERLLEQVADYEAALEFYGGDDPGSLAYEVLEKWKNES